MWTYKDISYMVYINIWLWQNYSRTRSKLLYKPEQQFIVFLFQISEQCFGNTFQHRSLQFISKLPRSLSLLKRDLNFLQLNTIKFSSVLSSKFHCCCQSEPQKYMARGKDFILEQSLHFYHFRKLPPSLARFNQLYRGRPVGDYL